VSISVVKCSLVIVVKFSEVLQCNDDTSNKVSNIIIRHTDYHINVLQVPFLSVYGCIPV